MTFREKAIDLMYNCGMFKEDAEKIFNERIKIDPTNNAMATRWNDDIEGYPSQMINVLWFNVKQNAREWITENQPQAWYLPMFQD